MLSHFWLKLITFKIMSLLSVCSSLLNVIIIYKLLLPPLFLMFFYFVKKLVSSCFLETKFAG